MSQTMVTVGRILPEFEEFFKMVKIQHANNQDCLQAFLKYVNLHDRCGDEWSRKEQELVEQLKNVTKEKDKQIKSLKKENDNLESKLSYARKLIDDYKLQKKKAEEERNMMECKVQEIHCLLQDNRNKLHDETREKLQYLSTIDQRLSTINESLYNDTTGSCLSDLSYSRSEDDMIDVDSKRASRKSRGLPDDHHAISAKRRRSAFSSARSEIVKAGPGECLIATTRVDLGNGGTPTASSVIEAFPSSKASCVPPLKPAKPTAPQMTTDSDSDELNILNRINNMKTPRIDRTPSNTALHSPSSNGFLSFGMTMMNTRTHSLGNKTIIRPENCDLCGKRIKFGRVALKCADCRTMCHIECKDKLKLPCIPPGSGTPTAKDSFGTISDYAPPTSPMIPAIVVHCINEIEERGLGEIGLYRVPGSDKEVKSLKEKFVKGRGVPNLSFVSDIHTIAGCLKDFLRSLQEPLATFTQRPKFVEDVQNKDLEARRAALYQHFTELPQPNRDTLAYLILHLQRVAEVPECRMPISSLAKVLGPTVIGYSRSDPEMIKMHMFEETQQSVQVMEELLSIPSEYWKNFLVHSTPSMPCTPSSSSLRDQCGFFYSPTSAGRLTVRKKKN